MCLSFPFLTQEKLKTGIFDGPQIRQLMKDAEFESSMTDSMVRFLPGGQQRFGKQEADNYAELVENINKYNIMAAYCRLGCNMSIKTQYILQDSLIIWAP